MLLSCLGGWPGCACIKKTNSNLFLQRRVSTENALLAPSSQSVSCDLDDARALSDADTEVIRRRLSDRSCRSCGALADPWRRAASRSSQAARRAAPLPALALARGPIGGAPRALLASGGLARRQGNADTWRLERRSTCSSSKLELLLHTASSLAISLAGTVLLRGALPVAGLAAARALDAVAAPLHRAHAVRLSASSGRGLERCAAARCAAAALWAGALRRACDLRAGPAARGGLGAGAAVPHCQPEPVLEGRGGWLERSGGRCSGAPGGDAAAAARRRAACAAAAARAA